jgi:hypothetical protein
MKWITHIHVAYKLKMSRVTQSLPQMSLRCAEKQKYCFYFTYEWGKVHPLRDLSFRTVDCEGKAIPLQALTDPEGSRRFRVSDFKTIGT